MKKLISILYGWKREAVPLGQTHRNYHLLIQFHGSDHFDSVFHRGGNGNKVLAVFSSL